MACMHMPCTVQHVCLVSAHGIRSSPGVLDQIKGDDEIQTEDDTEHTPTMARLYNAVNGLV